MGSVDAHQHFWRFNPQRDAWITEDMQVIRRDFLPDDLAPVMHASGVSHCVTVQADQSKEETHFLLELAERHPFIAGVVGWVDLQADDIDHQLSQYAGYAKLRGFRHILQGEQQRDFMLRPAFLNGIAQLEKYNFTYDILIYPDQLGFSTKMVERFPDQRFVVDHLAKPPIKEQRITGWKDDIRTLAKSGQVWCKVSGMITEADLKNWKPEDIRPFLDVVVEAFGTGRLMFGSDWPVALLAGSYQQVVAVVQDYFSSFPAADQDMIWRKNAIDFYQLNIPK